MTFLSSRHLSLGGKATQNRSLRYVSGPQNLTQEGGGAVVLCRQADGSLVYQELLVDTPAFPGFYWSGSGNMSTALPDGTPCHPYRLVQGKQIFDVYDPWTASESGIAVGDRRHWDGVWLECSAITTGTCGSTEPTVPAAGGTVVDGGVTWSRTNNSVSAANYYAECKGGVLCEPAATGSALSSRDLTAAAWVKSNITAAKDQSGIDAVANSCSSLLATAASATCLQSVTKTISDYAFGADIKRIAGTGAVEITIDGGTTWVDVTASLSTTEWYRAETTQNIANPQIGFRLADSGDKIAVDYANVEGGTFVTSRIETTDAGVVRQSSDITVPTNFSGYKFATLISLFGYQKTQIIGGAAFKLPLANDTLSMMVFNTSAAIETILSGRTEYALMGRTDETSICHRIDDSAGPYQITFVGNNGAVYQTTANDVTTDVAAQGLTAPVWVFVPAEVCYSTSLTYISVSANQLTGQTNQLTGNIPDLSSNTALVTFACDDNQLTGNIPDLSSNTALTYFSCYSNQLTGNIPDLSSNTALTSFSCSYNQLTGNIPDLSSNTALVYFGCFSNQLTGNIPDLSSNTALTYFSCYSNQLTGNIPDLSSNTALTSFHCYSNQLTGNIPDLSSNTALTYFSCYSNQLTTVDPGFSVPNKAFKFRAENNQLSVDAVNAILIAFDAVVTASGGTINIGGTGNAAPTGDGLTAKANMISKGWTVTTN